MKGAIAAALASAALANALTPVTVSGNAFFNGTDRFYIRGVDYQPGGSSDLTDPIADVAGCTRDVAEFKKLGLNTIRVYTVDNTASHDTCMSLLADAGIYLALDVNTPLYSLNRGDPAASYNPTYLQNIFATIDAFSGYNNTLLFFSGNEVINSNDTTDCAPYVKAVTRDMKTYIGSRGYRSIPVGYSAADVDSNRYEMAEYMNCGTSDERSDFFSFNDYSWCDPSSYETSGWAAEVALYGNYSIPLFLSEYGCNTNTRTFEEVASLYGTEMTPVYSGGLVYEYSEEGNDYGLGTINGTTFTANSQFTALMTELADNPDPSGGGNYSTTNQPATCPAESSSWSLGNFTSDSLPAIPSGAVKYFSEGAGTGAGLTGDGSQNAGGESTTTATAGSGAVTSTASASGTTTAKSSSTSKSSSTAKSAANLVRSVDLGFAPFVCGAVVLVGSLLGASLL